MHRGCDPSWGSLGWWDSARGEVCQGHQGLKPEGSSARGSGERKANEGGREAVMGRPHYPGLRQPSPRGVAPLRPSHSARPSRLGQAPPALVPAHLLGPRTPSPEPPRPRSIGGGRASSGPGSPSKLLASSLLHLPPQLRSASPGQEGPCPPRPLPPRLHKVAGRRPPARPEGRGPRGSPAGELHRSGHAPGTQGCTGCGWVAAQCTLSCSSL